MNKVCLTGVSGFVGQNLWKYLAAEGEGLSSLSLREKIDNTLLNNADVVVHLAGKAHDLKNTSDPEEYYHANFELTKKLYDVFLESNVQTFIFISSVKAVADNADFPLTENTVPNPLTHYGKSKLMAEEYIQNRPLPAGKFLYILRPSMIHGPGNKGNLNLLYNFIRKKIPYPLGCFQNRRSFLSIENLCFVINEFINNKTIPSGTYHVADDESLSTNELIIQIGMLIGLKPTIWKINKKLIQQLAKIGDLLHLPFNSGVLGKLAENYEVSNKKLLEALHIELPVSAREGIKKTILSFKKS